MTMWWHQFEFTIMYESSTSTSAAQTKSHAASGHETLSTCLSQRMLDRTQRSMAGTWVKDLCPT